MPRDSVVELMITIAACRLANLDQRQRAYELAWDLGGLEAGLEVVRRRQTP